MTAIRLDRVFKSFGDHRAVDDLSLDVPPASVYGVIGPNGSGKTTTLRMILHILLPDRGEIEVLGRRGTRAANDEIGYLPEERGLYRKMELRRQLAYFASLKGMSPRDARREIDEWLARLDLEAWAEAPVEALSKGMAQKAQFISTVVARPRLVILDEPFSGLDPVNLESMRAAILLLKERGTTVLLSTHDMPVAEQMCDRICMIFKGRKVLDGTLESIQRQYGADRIRVRLADGRNHLGEMEGVESVRDLGRVQELRLKGDPQEFLRRLQAKGPVEHFEIKRPSLHDIFIRIAGPQANPGEEADA
jgi:ABC-2 type transport system ATP-binding protein